MAAREIRIGALVFTDWKVVREIGKGSSGTVYEIRKENQGAALSAALKVLRIPEDSRVIESLRGDGLSGESVTNYLQRLVEELIEEIRIMISLKEFAHVVKCEDFSVEHDAQSTQWTVLIRMELLESVSSFRQTHDLTEADVHRLALHLTRALVLLEDQNIIHRDIKPENIFINQFGDFKIGDFGITRIYDQSNPVLSQKGTQSYMAPEVFHARDYDHTVDIYSLGLVLYKFLNLNRLPFLPVEGDFSPIDRQSALAMRLSGRKELDPPVCASPEFARIVLRMCANRAEDRYPSARALLRDLEAFVPANRVVLAADTAPARAPVAEDRTGGTDESERSQPVEDPTDMGSASSRPHAAGTESRTVRPLSPGGSTQAPPQPSPHRVANDAQRSSGAQGAGDSQSVAGSQGVSNSQGATGAPERARESRNYVPSGDVRGDGTSGSKSKSAKQLILLTAALMVIALAVLIPAFLSKEYALVVRGGSGSGSYKAGTVVTIEAEEIVGKVFEGWTASGIKLVDAVSAELVVTMPRHSVEVEARFGDAQYALDVNAGSGSGQYVYGATVTAAADAAQPGYAFQRWEVSRGTIEVENLDAPTLTFAMPDGDVVLTALYAPLNYRLKVNGASGGGKYAFGEEITLTAQEQAHAAFVGWTVDAGELLLSEEETDGMELSFAMPACDLTLSAVFKTNEHAVSVTGGSGSGVYAVGETVEIAADAPGEGMAFSGWRNLKGRPALENASLPETSFVMPDQEVEIEAQYDPKVFQLNVQNASGTGTYPFGTRVVLFADALEHYSFMCWSVDSGTLELEDGALEQPSLSFDMPANDLTIRAIYAIHQHQASVLGGEGSGTYAVGETVEISANVAAAGLSFSGWKTLKGRPALENSALPQTSFVMPDQDVELEADYAPIEYKLTVNGGGGSGSYHLNDMVTIYADAVKNSLNFERWTVDQGSVRLSDPQVQSLTFRMPAEDVTISAHYAGTKRVVKVVNGRGSGMYTVGDVVTVIAEDHSLDGLNFAYWTVDGGTLDVRDLDLTQPSLRFTMPDSALTLTANYSKQVVSGHVLSVNGGSGSGQYAAGTKVTVQAEAPNPGMSFVYWLVNGYPGELDVRSARLEITMPDNDVIFTAFFANR